MENIYCREYLKQASDEELINIYKLYNCSFKNILNVFNCSKNMVNRLYIKRNIDYHSIRRAYIQLKIEKYYANPKYCKQCGKPISYSYRRNAFCNSSCAALYNNIRKESRIKKLYCIYCGKELKDFQRWANLKYCSLDCKKQDIYNNYITNWLEGKETGTIGNYGISLHIRRYLFEKYNSSCQKCGWHEVHPITNKVPLQIHHIDGNCLNNKEENLQLLCPNCHSLTETFGSLNENSARIYRILKNNIHNWEEA